MPIDGEVKGLPVHGTPVQLPGRNTWLSSFVITKDARFYRDADPFSEGGLAGSGRAQADRGRPPEFHSVQVRWHDALFSDGRGTESWSLLNKRGFISNWWLMTQYTDEGPVSQINVFSAVVSDTNSDGYLDDKDAAVAILTDGSGRGAQVATPEDMQLTAVHYVADSQMLGFEVREDENGDGVFAKDEPIHFYFRFPFEDGATTWPWHSGEFLDDLDSIYR